MDSATVLIIDDEPQIRRVLRAVLVQAGYVAVEAANGQEALEVLCREHPGVILLDGNLPDVSGIQLCLSIRLSFEGPIIMVSVRNTERDKVDAFNAGVNDYVVKPFAAGELLARIRNALRASAPHESALRIETRDLVIDLETRTVDVRGDRVHLTPKEFDVLRALVTHQGKAVSYQKLLQTIWGPEYAEETEKVRAVIGQIRKKIEKNCARPRYIVTEPWFGYRFEVPESEGASRHPKS